MAKLDVAFITGAADGAPIAFLAHIDPFNSFCSKAEVVADVRL
jgi:hypothetical protein